tara:strand:+ start:260 stop:766 length:507 start_codon:yes stop_codon:yes gene_type:complete
MATRNVTMVVDRKHAKKHSEGFAANPCVYADNSYVNMYLHHDGYPEWQGVQLANFLKANAIQDGTSLAAKLVYNMYYDSCYLYSDHQHIDHHYTYIIWTGDREDIWVSCWDQYSNRNVFVLTPNKIIDKYKEDMEYTRFDKGQTRYIQGKSDDVKYYTDKLIELLQNF